MGNKGTNFSLGENEIMKATKINPDDNTDYIFQKYDWLKLTFFRLFFDNKIAQIITTYERNQMRVQIEVNKTCKGCLQHSFL